jgi:hypothetical protein
VSKQNLIIFVTPHIVRDAAKMRQLVVNELRQRADRIDEELSEIGLEPITNTGLENVPSAQPGLLGPQ